MNTAGESGPDPADPAAPKWLVSTVRGIDRFTRALAMFFALMVVPLVLIMVYEVLARYLFNAPTIWAYDLSYQLYGSHFMLGAAYALYRGAHIRTDVFYHKWSVRRKGVIDATLYILFFFPGMVFYFWMGWDEFTHSWDIGERSDASPWRPIIWPFKGIIPLAVLLLFIQGISEFLKSGWAAIKGRPLL